MKKVLPSDLFNLVSLGGDLHLIFHDFKIELIDSELNLLGSV